MCRIAIGILASVALASGASAPVIATVSSAQAFSVDGHLFPAAGVLSWPLVAGDRIATDTAPAIVTLKDGSQFVVAPHSEVTVHLSETRSTVQAKSGTVAVLPKHTATYLRSNETSNVTASSAASALPALNAAPSTKPPPISNHKCGDADHGNGCPA